jgi:hypothetical protein
LTKIGQRNSTSQEGRVHDVDASSSTEGSVKAPSGNSVEPNEQAGYEIVTKSEDKSAIPNPVPNFVW